MNQVKVSQFLKISPRVEYWRRRPPEYSRTDAFCLAGIGQESPGTSYENVISGHDSPETSVEKKYFRKWT